MPKLTINSVCAKGPVYPLIFNFQNGYPSKDFECRCCVIQDINGGTKTIAAQFGRILYVGAEETNDTGQTLLLVRNRKTGKVRLIETGSVEMKSIIDESPRQCTQTSNMEVNNALQKQLPPQSESCEINVNKTFKQTQSLETSDTDLNMSIEGYCHVARPNKRGSTTRFSQNNLGDFQQLYNFAVDEISTIPNHLQSETEFYNSPKSIDSNRSLEELRAGACKKIASNTQLDVLDSKGRKIQSEEAASKNINIATVELKETHKITDNEELPEAGAAIDTEIITGKKINYTINNEPEELHISETIASTEIPEMPKDTEEKEIGLETERLTSEDISSTIDIEELSILSSDALSEDTDSEFEDITNLNSKLNREEYEDHQILQQKDYSIKQYFVAALELNSTGDKSTKQNADLWTSNNNLINDRVNNDSIISNHTDNIYICNNCEAVIKDKGSLIFHMISHKFEMSLVNDETLSVNTGTNIGGVNEIAKNPLNSTQHNIRKKIDNSYICDYCGAIFENKGSLVIHISSHEFNCTYYDVTQSKVKSKQNKNHNSYSDNYCNTMSGKKKEINPDFNKLSTKLEDGESRNRKLKINTGQSLSENIHICDYCETEFDNKDSLVFHIISHKSKEEDNIKQSDIEKTKKTNNVHENPSQNNGLIVNQKKVSTVVTDLSNNNEVSSEQNAIDNTHKNDYCGVVFEDKDLLILHVTTHEYLKDRDNVTQLRRSKRIYEKNNGNQSGWLENSSKSNNMKKQEKINSDLTVMSRTLNNHVNKKGKNSNTYGTIITDTKLRNADEGKQIVSGETEIKKATGNVTVTTRLINCKHCSYKTDDTTTTNILNHILTHTVNSNPNKDYICNDCGKEYKSKASIIIHLDSHRTNSNRRNPRIYPCTTCNSTFSTQAVLIRHQSKMHPPTKTYKCTLCDFKSSSAPKLTVHKQTHKTKPFLCTICEHQCNEKNFAKHMKSHTSSKSLQCKYCDAKFSWKSALMQHMIKHSGKKEHKCTICDSKFSWLSGLKRHVLIHSKVKPFICKDCSAGFNDVSTLKNHLKIHSGEKPFKCTHCKYSCITSGDLKRHLKVHNKKLKRASSHVVQPFHCTLCDSKFGLKSSLICHMKTHTGEKTHKCTFCDKSFLHYTGLKRHLNVHSKPIKCTTCNTSYKNETALKWHLRRGRKHQ